MAAMENRTGGYGGVAATLSAAQKAAGLPPEFCMGTVEAVKTIRPTKSIEVLSACFFGSEPLLEFEQGRWIGYSHIAILAERGTKGDTHELTMLSSYGLGTIRKQAVGILQGG